MMAPFTIRYEWAGVELHYSRELQPWCCKLSVENWDSTRGYRLYVLAGDSPSIIVADTASANKAGVSCHKLIYLRLEKE